MPKLPPNVVGLLYDRHTPTVLETHFGLCIGALAGFVAILTRYTTPLLAVVWEEMLKWLAISLFRSPVLPRRWDEGAVVGLGFALTEAVLYTMSAFMSGGSPWTMRLLVTVPMHVVCGALISRYPMGIFGSLFVHGIFNAFVR